MAVSNYNPVLSGRKYRKLPFVEMLGSLSTLNTQSLELSGKCFIKSILEEIWFRQVLYSR